LRDPKHEGKTTMSAKPSPKSWRDLLPIHPAADLFPLMSTAEAAKAREA
jgi:hypothetical protein